MLKKIESLRKEPKHVRNRYAFWIAFAFTLLLTIVWAISLPSTLNREYVTPDSKSDVDAREDIGRIKQTLNNFVTRFREGIVEFQTQSQTYTASSTPEEVPEQRDFTELFITATTTSSTDEAVLESTETEATSTNATTTAGE